MDGSPLKDIIKIQEEGVSFFRDLLGYNYISQQRAANKLLKNIPYLVDVRINNNLNQKFKAK